MGAPVQTVKFATASTVTLTGEITSDSFDIANKDAVVLQPIFSGEADFEGRIHLEYSIDEDNWAKDVNSECLIRGQDNFIYNLVSHSAPHVRVKAFKDAGTGTTTLTVKAFSKPIHK